MQLMKLLEFPMFRQASPYDCGVIAAQAVLAYFGINLRADHIIKEAGTTTSGTSVEGIIQVLRNANLECDARILTIDEIKAAIDQSNPVIVVLQAWCDKPVAKWEECWTEGHYVIIIGYDTHRLYFEDPSSIQRTFLTLRAFKQRWHDIDDRGKKYLNYGIIVSGKKPEFSYRTFIPLG